MNAVVGSTQRRPEIHYRESRTKLPATQFTSRLQSKLMLAAGSLLGVIAALATVLYFSTERYTFHLERAQLAHDVHSSYLAVSNHTYRKLNAMGEIVMQGDVGNVEERFANEQSLRDALADVRRRIAAEVAYLNDETESDELDHLVEIERLSERIIRGSDEIQQAIRVGDQARARRELSALRSDTVAGKFSELIDQALAEESREASETEAAALAMGDWIMAVLPVAIVVVLLTGLLITMWFSRRLSRSLEALEQAANAYTSGNLDHRTELLPEQEFSRLGEAFNRMADELLARREEAERSQESLEVLVRKRTQELEASNEQLAESDRIRRQLLADISHELRTPLTVIQGESEMALRGAPKSVEEYQDAITRVREQALHTTRLVEDLLFVARAEEGKARIEMRAVALANVLRETCSDFRSAAEKKRIVINEEYADDQVVVYGDDRRLKQVFAILVDNAIRYSEVDGAITVSLEPAGEFARLSIKDNGIGLTEEEARQAFYRFYRGDNAERHANGTGLGLPVAKAIVEAHYGDISLTGEPGEGAQVTVRLPLENRLRAIA